jgi:glycosyltransferase involved in cell wall biosynthesis
MNPLFSIIIPVIRPEKAKRCMEAIRSTLAHSTLNYEIVTEEDTKRIGVTKMVKRLVEKSKGTHIVFLGDDTVPQTHWLHRAYDAMNHIPGGVGMVSFNDNPNTTRSAAHWMIHRDMLPLLGGEFFHTGYTHCFCDDELLIRCQQMNKYIYAYDAIIYHEHPAVHAGVPSDENYSRVHSNEVYGKDKALFEARMNNNWVTPEVVKKNEVKKTLKVIIGVPSNDLVHADFAMSLINLCIYSITRGIHVAIVNQKSSIVEVGRNQIVKTALEMDADYLLFLDSDMVFPAQTLVRLLAHKKDIVCTDATRRREPITTVLTGMDKQKVKHNPKADEKAPLIEVKGGTSAVQLVSTDVLKQMDVPHFLVTYNGEGGFLGEDYYFSNNARKNGFKVWCDTYLSQFIGHIGAKTYYLKDAEELDKKS